MAEEKFIEAVREHRELYDTKHVDYMKVKLKNRIWSDIAKDLNLKDAGPRDSNLRDDSNHSLQATTKTSARSDTLETEELEDNNSLDNEENEQSQDINNDESNDREDRVRQRAQERRALESNYIKDDPLYNFFISMCQLTKNMPHSYQRRIRGQLFQAFSLAEEEIMNVTLLSPRPEAYRFNLPVLAS
ncbi:uncharacterized protein LOC124556017 [Schistocerca americana]|uniref:uncharacterized protein LOC124556017 n=1 Tax=Schistocerca americana TaxID=7009 RepID=UPI001F4FBF3F|nr:uncharacterized protein LOC124556017 [Schistocerca americana]